MKNYKEKVIAEFSKLKLVEERWEGLGTILCFKWTELQPPPFSDDEVEIDLDIEQVKELATLLNEFIEKTKPIEGIKE